MITAAFTTYQRTTLLYEAVAPFLDHPFVSEVVISDDASDLNTTTQIEIFARKHPKIKLHINEVNVDCYRNKCIAVTISSNEWVAILDSDNIFGASYIDRLESLWQSGLHHKTAYQPDFARPHFNFEHLGGLNLTHKTVWRYANDDRCLTALNAMNYFVNRAEFLRVFDNSVDPVTSDSIFHNSNWLQAGNSIYIVPGLQYEHRVHEGSHYRNNVRRTPQGFHDLIVQKLKRMR